MLEWLVALFWATVDDTNNYMNSLQINYEHVIQITSMKQTNNQTNERFILIIFELNAYSKLNSY